MPDFETPQDFSDQPIDAKKWAQEQLSADPRVRLAYQERQLLEALGLKLQLQRAIQGLSLAEIAARVELDAQILDGIEKGRVLFRFTPEEEATRNKLMQISVILGLDILLEMGRLKELEQERLRSSKVPDGYSF